MLRSGWAIVKYSFGQLETIDDQYLFNLFANFMYSFQWHKKQVITQTTTTTTISVYWMISNLEWICSWLEICTVLCKLENGLKIVNSFRRNSVCSTQHFFLHNVIFQFGILVCTSNEYIRHTNRNMLSFFPYEWKS